MYASAAPSRRRSGKNRTLFSLSFCPDTKERKNQVASLRSLKIIEKKNCIEIKKYYIW